MIRHKITRMTATTYVLESMVYLTAGLVDRHVGDYSLEGACCKVFGTEVLWQNINDGLQIAGGNGFMNEYPYGRALRDSRINMIFEGTNEILRLLIALSGMKELGDSLKEVQCALKSPLAQRGILTEYAHKRLKGVITHDKLTKVHPSLAPEADQVGRYAGVFANACETILRKHGKKVVDKEYQQERIADVLIDLYAQIATLSRVTSSIAKKGEEKAAGEIEIARWFCVRGPAPHGREPQGPRQEPRRGVHVDQRPRLRGGRVPVRPLGVRGATQPASSFIRTLTLPTPFPVGPVNVHVVLRDPVTLIDAGR